MPGFFFCRDPHNLHRPRPYKQRRVGAGIGKFEKRMLYTFSDESPFLNKKPRTNFASHRNLPIKELK
jgi:hypothetical protein